MRTTIALISERVIAQSWKRQKRKKHFGPTRGERDPWKIIHILAAGGGSTHIVVIVVLRLMVERGGVA
jgi:hypothetical protein